LTYREAATMKADSRASDDALHALHASADETSRRIAQENLTAAARHTSTCADECARALESLLSDPDSAPRQAWAREVVQRWRHAQAAEVTASGEVARVYRELEERARERGRRVGAMAAAQGGEPVKPPDGADR
jgi:hypothetical protein